MCLSHLGMHDTCLVPCVTESCPLGREGPLGCHVVPYTSDISLTMDKQLPPERVVLCIQQF